MSTPSRPARAERHAGTFVSPASRPTVAVIGAGFSGLMTALQLLERPDGPRVRLIERRQPFACGAAYSTTFRDHLLNVRAANMSAYPDRPSHFVDWLATQGEPYRDTAFVRRSRYGGYLKAMLATAAERSEAGRLLLEADAVVGLEPWGERWRLTYAMGRVIEVDAVILAVGNFPPHLPAGVGEAAAQSEAFIGDPWTSDLASAPEAGHALLIGTGLTMVDVALRLAAERPGLTLTAISRRGLLPQRHQESGPTPLTWDPGRKTTVRGLIRRMRELAKDADWRTVIDGVRPHVQTIWRGWSVKEQRRFLRHARPWWDVHRHRLAPAVARRIDELIAVRALNVHAGRFVAMTPEGERLSIHWRRKGSAVVEGFKADLVVNCSGPTGQLARSADPLIAALARQGLIRPDPQNLGLDVDALGRLVTEAGAASDRLYSIGPATRGAFWEITSVPDIRVQAASLAHQVCDQLQGVDREADADPAAARRPTPTPQEAWT